MRLLGRLRYAALTLALAFPLLASTATSQSAVTGGPTASAAKALSNRQFSEARKRYDAALAAAALSNDLRGQAEAAGGRGLSELGLRDRDAALADFARSIEFARRGAFADIVARSRFNYAVALPGAEAGVGESFAWYSGIGSTRGEDVSDNERKDAADAFGAAAEAADAANLPLLASKAHAHAARLLGASADAPLYRAAALSALRAGAPGNSRSSAALVVGDAALTASARGAPDAAPIALEALMMALTDARATNDGLSQATARGLLARLYWLQGRRADAMSLTRDAILLADKAGAPDQIFAWQGQLGRMLELSGDQAGALAAYADAARYIEAARPLLARATPLDGRSSYRAAIDPILLSYANLLLRSGGGDQGAKLRKVRELVDHLKSLELDQYFNDACISQAISGEVEVERVASNAAVIYPIIFDDRVDLIVSTGERVELRNGGMNAAAIGAAADRLASSLRDPKTLYDYADARALYNALIAPIEDILQREKITTLVITPDGPLRKIPLAALHDGARFLVERYAVATELGLSLVDPRPMRASDRRAVLAGVSQRVRVPGTDELSPPLENVPAELKSVGAIVSGPQLLDATFTKANFANALDRERFSIAHLATHAKFGASSAQSFILTHDGSISLDELGTMMERARTRGQSLELLVLSACETAASDDRAVLGIAGAAYRSGARAVLATLWPIEDEPTARMMPDFYQGLASGNNKAEALRQAQLKLLADKGTAHPSNWAAFILVGNWL